MPSYMTIIAYILWEDHPTLYHSKPILDHVGLETVRLHKGVKEPTKYNTIISAKYCDVIAKVR